MRSKKPSVERRLLCVFQHAPTRGAPGLGYRHRLYFSELVRRGWHVDLVSTPVNYMTGEVPAPYSGRLLSQEVIDGIVHHWVWALPRIHASRRRRALNYLSFAATSTMRAASLPRPSIILASSPPLSIAPIGALLAARFRRPWILEIRDPWPEAAAAAGWLSPESRMYQVLERLSRHYESTADGVLLPTPGLVESVQAHGARRVVVVTGAVAAPTESKARTRIRGELGATDGTCVFVYVGAFGVVNGLDIVLDAAKALPRDSAMIVLVGDGSDRDRLQRRLRGENIDNVQMLGAVPRESVDDLLAASDVCLHILRSDPFFAYALPNKILSYLEAHRPFITNVPGVPAKLASESGGAFCESPQELERELQRWIAMSPEERRKRGEEAFAYGREHFRLEANIDRLEEMLEDSIARHRP